MLLKCFVHSKIPFRANPLMNHHKNGFEKHLKERERTKLRTMRYPKFNIYFLSTSLTFFPLSSRKALLLLKEDDLLFPIIETDTYICISDESRKLAPLTCDITLAPSPFLSLSLSLPPSSPPHENPSSTDMLTYLTAAEVAQQLTLYQHFLYSSVRGREVLQWSKSKVVSDFDFFSSSLFLICSTE